MKDPIIILENVVKNYYIGKITIPALLGINLIVEKEKFISIMGPSGSGKTTLFNLIGGLDKPTFGTIYLDGVDIAALSVSEIAQVRTHLIGFIFQKFNLIPTLTAFENVELAAIIAGKSRETRNKVVKELIADVGLSDRMNHRPAALSGGQQQRVAIARALVNKPHIVLADEPTGNLDMKTGLEILELLKRESAANEATTLVVTHDQKIVKISDEIVWINNGRIGERRSLQELGGIVID